MTYWKWLGFVLAGMTGSFVLALVIIATSATRNVDHYYIADAKYVGLTCVWGFVNWGSDRRVFCSDDPFKVLEVARRANALLKVNRSDEF